MKQYKTPFILLTSLKSRKHRLYLTSWRKKIWAIWDNDTWYHDLVRFEKRNAAIMWLKRYGKNNVTYRLERQSGIHAWVRVVNGYVYFYNPNNELMFPAESKRTHPHAVRNN